MKHTKAPWFSVDYAGTFILQSGPHYDDQSLLDYNEFHDNPVDKETAEANSLIAVKAPEMLEALKDAEKIILQVHQYGLTCGLNDSNIDKLENIQSILKDLE